MSFWPRTNRILGPAKCTVRLADARRTGPQRPHRLRKAFVNAAMFMVIMEQHQERRRRARIIDCGARVLASIALASVVCACGNEGPVSRSIAATVEKGPGTRLTLADHTGFPWDKVCILGPYTPDDKVDALTGIQGAAAHAYDIRSNDAINVLMFVREGRIASSVAHRRDRGDFSPEVIGKCYSTEHAKFSIRVPPPNSWGNIGPE
jgi:hypothetical protein